MRVSDSFCQLRRPRKLQSSAIILILLVFSCSVQGAYTATKSQILVNLAAIKNEWAKELNVSEKKISLKFEALSQAQKSQNYSESFTLSQVEQLDGLNKSKVDKEMKLDLMEKLQSKMELNWKGQPLRPFIQEYLTQVSRQEINNKSAGKYWQFILFLSMSLNESQDSPDKILGTIRAYMKTNTIWNPKHPKSFFENRDYTNNYGDQVKSETPQGFFK